MTPKGKNNAIVAVEKVLDPNRETAEKRSGKEANGGRAEKRLSLTGPGYERDVRGFAHKLCCHVRDRCFISKGLFDAPPAAGQSEKWRLAS
jgi:hypothetical protein